MTTEVEQRKRPAWMKWTLRLLLGYLTVLAIILAITIITILITFTFVIIDGFSDSSSLGEIAETYLVPFSEFMWKLFTWLIPGV